MGDYVMTLAETDPDLFSTSLVLSTEKETRLNPDGTTQHDADGEPLPPLWRPKQLMACDVVSTGDAVDGLLGRMGGTLENLSRLPNGVVFLAAATLDKHFAGKGRDYIEEHCRAYLQRYLDRRYGPKTLNGPAGSVGGEEEPGSPNAPQHRDDNPYAEAPQEVLHDGCRSTHGLHRVTICRKCNQEMSDLSCNCKHRDYESRVVVMAKEPCAACKAKLEAPGAAKDGEKNPGNTGDTSPTADASPDLDLHAMQMTMQELA
jgi:hypothetical protein